MTTVMLLLSYYDLKFNDFRATLATTRELVVELRKHLAKEQWTLIASLTQEKRQHREFAKLVGQ